MLVPSNRVTKLPVAVAVCAVLTGAIAVGCSSPSEEGAGECPARGAEALTTCAKATTLTGIDVSYYQGNVSWSQVKGAGRDFAFVRISDGLHYPDTKWAQNWPA